MPIFEFVCKGCGRQFEEIMTFAAMEAGEAVCPDCGSRDITRNLSAFATGSDSGSSGGGGGGCGPGGFT
jgi:putative FmdB family regulatory protein